MQNFLWYNNIIMQSAKRFVYVFMSSSLILFVFTVGHTRQTNFKMSFSCYYHHSSALIDQ